MRNGISSILLLGLAAAEAGASEMPDDTGPRTAALVTIVQDSGNTLLRELNATQSDPEARAIRIEQWQEERNPLLKQLKEASAADLRREKASPVVGDPNAVASETSEAVDSPILGEDSETEAEIQSFRRHLETATVTPEERAIQVEEFQEINRHALAPLKNPIRQADMQDGSGASIASEDAKPAASPVREETTSLQTEIRRILRDLAETDSETRAMYLEAHAATLAVMTGTLRTRPANQEQAPEELIQPASKPTSSKP